MSQQHQPAQQANEDIEAATAAIYARVSSFGQLGRDGDEDGYSLPAQVEACKREALQRGATPIKVYMERAESAKTDDRPVLQAMLRELPALGVKYLIVHKVDRLARNRLDDATLYQRIVGMGITLVSATENIDETPAGRLMHGMLASFAEYYSNNLATEVKKGLRRKHEQGGTPHRPPIGYRSKREWVSGQDIRTVEIDPERAPLVRLAFGLYATGLWTTRRLAAHLTEQGLRSRATRRHPERPLTASRIQELLRNSYYIGVVTWDGRSYPGKHDKLIDQETFDTVQALLAAAKVGGDRPQVHQHYLRGSVFCEKCHGRLLYGRHQGRSRHYEYFCCNNRTVRGRAVQCPSGHLAVDATEDSVIADVYSVVSLDAKAKAQIRSELRQELSERTAVIRQEAERHEWALKAIEAKQEKLVQLYYRDLVSEDVFAAEQEKLKFERRAATRSQATATAQLEDVQVALEIALSRVEQAELAYREGTPLERRILNQAIFQRIDIGPDGKATGTALTPVYDALSAWQPGFGQPKEKADTHDGPFPSPVQPCHALSHRHGFAAFPRGRPLDGGRIAFGGRDRGAARHDDITSPATLRPKRPCRCHRSDGVFDLF
ncbi:MAG TPA: recombinase family protein [Microbacteriaceae bacterium]|jgi:DNA invertase Pin-like site-specific DNA recombinase|nr:recombinase family protein [Microbacteriaceae bacterium]